MRPAMILLAFTAVACVACVAIGFMLPTKSNPFITAPELTQAEREALLPKDCKIHSRLSPTEVITVTTTGVTEGLYALREWRADKDGVSYWHYKPSDDIDNINRKAAEIKMMERLAGLENADAPKPATK